MKVALLSESPADEAAVKVLVEAVLGEPIQQVHPALRARGWPNVAQVLPAIIRHLHFNTAAEGLVVVVDSDDSTVHTEAHEAPDYFHPQCRLCQLRAVYRQTMKKLPARKAAGVPAKVLRTLSEQEMAWKAEGTLTYQELTRRSLATLVEADALTAVEPDRKRFDLPGVLPLIELRKQTQRSE